MTQCARRMRPSRHRLQEATLRDQIKYESQEENERFAASRKAIELGFIDWWMTDVFAVSPQCVKLSLIKAASLTASFQIKKLQYCNMHVLSD